MRKLTSHVALALITFTLTLIPPASCPAQSPAASAEEITARKAALLAELQALEISAAKLDAPLARAAARTEIAAAAWTLDEDWAERLLRDAYSLTLPDAPERERLRAVKVGAPLVFPPGDERARGAARRRVLEVAARDHGFAEELIRLGGEELGARERHYGYGQLAARAARDGDLAAAADYAAQALDADPTLLDGGDAVARIALTDRKAADGLILQLIERLRALQVSGEGSMRASLLLDTLVLYYNEPFFFAPPDSPEAARYRQAQPPGAEVLRAYVAYTLDEIAALERRAPGSAQRMRVRLGLISNMQRRYAPELTPEFNELERLSRKPGENAPLRSQEEFAEDSRKQYERRVKDAMASDQPDDTLIQLIVGRGDFERARKLIAKLPDGARKAQLTETCDAKEALALSARGDAAQAELLAERLVNASLILQVYPALLRACVASKDSACPPRLVYQAVRRLKRADTTPPAMPAEIPAAAMPSNRELDRVLLSLSQLAAQVAPASDALALELLQEIVEAANRSEVDTAQGRTGFDAEVFRLLAARAGVRARQAAADFKDRLRQIVSLATIDGAEADELSKRAEEPGKKP